MLYLHLLLYLEVLPFCPNVFTYGTVSSRGLHVNYYLYVSNIKGTLSTSRTCLSLYRYYKRNKLQLKMSVLTERLPYPSFKNLPSKLLGIHGASGFQMLLCLVTTWRAQQNTGCWVPPPPTVIQQVWGRPGRHMSYKLLDGDEAVAWD